MPDIDETIHDLKSRVAKMENTLYHGEGTQRPILVQLAEMDTKLRAVEYNVSKIQGGISKLAWLIVSSFIGQMAMLVAQKVF